MFLCNTHILDLMEIYITVLFQQIQHGKNYESNEDEARLLVFLENRKKIVDHNRRFEMGLVTYTMAMNQFGDMVRT